MVGDVRHGVRQRGQPLEGGLARTKSAPNCRSTGGAREAAHHPWVSKSARRSHCLQSQTQRCSAQLSTLAALFLSYGIFPKPPADPLPPPKRGSSLLMKQGKWNDHLPYIEGVASSHFGPTRRCCAARLRPSHTPCSSKQLSHPVAVFRSLWRQPQPQPQHLIPRCLVSRHLMSSFACRIPSTSPRSV